MEVKQSPGKFKGIATEPEGEILSARDTIVGRLE
jgi:hypothetical protein